MDPTGPLCRSPHQTSVHILNGCPEALNQGRYTWRHDSVLNCLLLSIRANISSAITIFADLPGYRACENPQATIPVDLSVSSALRTLF